MRLLRLAVGALMLSGALALIVPGAIGTASAQTPPSTCPTGTTLVNGTCQPPGTAPGTCPAGTTFNPATNACEDGPVCPAGVSFAGGTCTGLAVDSCPAGAAGTVGVAPNPLPPPEFICFGPPPPASVDCPTGTTFTPGVAPTGLDSTCSSAPAACPAGLAANAGGVCGTAPACPAGNTLTNGLCLPAGTAPTCAAGEQFVPQVGLCFPVGGTGSAFANGGNGGSARGGDGGRGGDGVAPQCNQNTSDTDWDVELAVSCGAGGAGGAAGDGGISEGGDGGLAFTDSLF
jgi:hypothetical protein